MVAKSKKKFLSYKLHISSKLDEDNVDDIVQMLENKKSFTDYGYDKNSLSAFMTEDQKLFVEYSETLREFAAYLQKVRKNA